MKHTTTTAADVKVVVWFRLERADGVSPHVWNILQLKIQKNYTFIKKTSNQI